MEFLRLQPRLLFGLTEAQLFAIVLFATGLWLWARSGRELFYKDGERQLVSAQVLPGTTFVLGERRALFSTATYGGGDGHRTYDITPDDRRFVMIRGLAAGNEPTAALVVVDHFFRELREKVGGR